MQECISAVAWHRDRVATSCFSKPANAFISTSMRYIPCYLIFTVLLKKEGKKIRNEMSELFFHYAASYLQYFNGNTVSTPHASFLPAIFQWWCCFHTACKLPTCNISVASYLWYFSGNIVSTPQASFLPAIFQWRCCFTLHASFLPAIFQWWSIWFLLWLRARHAFCFWADWLLTEKNMFKVNSEFLWCCCLNRKGGRGEGCTFSKNISCIRMSTV